MAQPAQSLKELFLAALEVTPEQRAAWLLRECGDVDMREQITLMLDAHAVPQSLFDQIAILSLNSLGSNCQTSVDEFFVAPGTMIDGYKLLQQIGEGGMGTVYMAEQTHPVRRKVAIKVIKPGMDSGQVIARFEAERQALAMMDHVNIARVLDAGTTQAGRPYFVMELVHGQPITKYCNENRLTLRQRLELFVPVCHAIQHAHQKGIIHRDIKPSNVMITLYDGLPVPKVIDFGVARAIDQKLTERTLFTQYGTIVGTLEYMSPEQAEFSALGVDTRGDIYSLGVVLYELLTGSTPLTRKQLQEVALVEVLRIIREVEPPKPSTRLDASRETLPAISAQRQMEPTKLTKLLSGELDWIVMKCLEKDRNRRYPTANGFAADIQRYLANEPVQACPPSVLYSLRKFANRNRNRLAVSVLLMICILTLLGGIGWAIRDHFADRQQLAQSHLARAIGFRYSAQPGHKALCLDEIAAAVKLDPPKDMRLELRNVAIAGLVQTDVRFERRPSDWGAERPLRLSFDRYYESYLMSNPNATTSIRQYGSGNLICSIPYRADDGVHPRLSANAKFVYFHHTAPPCKLTVWDVARNEKLLGPIDLNDWYSVDSDERNLFVCQGDKAVHVYSLETGLEVRKLVVGHNANWPVLSPDDSRLAISFEDRPGVVQVIDAHSGDVQTEFTIDTAIRALDWHPDGLKLALAGGESYTAEIWDIASRRRLVQLVGHEQDVTSVAFDLTGDYVTSGSWDGTRRVWGWTNANEVAALTGIYSVNSWDKNSLGSYVDENEIVIAKIDEPIGLKTLAVYTPKHTEVDLQGDTSPDGSLLAVDSTEGLEIWNLESRQKLAEFNQPGLLATRFDWTHQRIVTMGRTAGLQHWPIEELDGHWRVAPAASVADTSVLSLKACSSADGQRWACIDGNRARVVTDEGKVICDLAVPEMHDTVCFSPDGEMLVTSGWHSPTINIWKVATGGLLKQLTGNMTARFSPDSSQLVESIHSEYTFRDVKNWQIIRRIKRSDCSYPGAFAYSPSEDLLALELTPGALHLLRTSDYSTVAILECPLQNRPTGFSFCRQGQRLISFHHRKGEIYVWDLTSLRSRLALLGLDWEDRPSNDARATQIIANDLLAGLKLPTSIEFIAGPQSAENELRLAQRSLQAAEQQLLETPTSLTAANSLAWHLLTGPQDSRDLDRAVKLLEPALSKLDANSRNTMAVAYYRTARFKDAVELLRQNLLEQEDASLGYDLYFLAMCYWQLDELEHARDTFEWAERMRRLHPPEDAESEKEVEGIRAEARALVSRKP
jgi:eukaryotic-like serine/threonine-protein kinase